MTLGPEAWLLVVAVAILGVGGTLLTMAAAIRRGVSIIELEFRIRELRAEHRQRMIERGLVEPDDGEVIEVDVVDDDELDAESVAQPQAA